MTKLLSKLLHYIFLQIELCSLNKQIQSIFLYHVYEI